MAALMRRWRKPKPRPMIVFTRAADPWADHPLWGATGPYDHPLYAPTIALPIIRHRAREAAR